MITVELFQIDWKTSHTIDLDRVPVVGEKICVQDEKKFHNDFRYTIYEVVEVMHMFSFDISGRAYVYVKEVARDVDAFDWIRTNCGKEK